jgi:hypothetical protein
VVSPSPFDCNIAGVSVIKPLVAFYDIHEGKREVLFFCSVPDPIALHFAVNTALKSSNKEDKKNPTKKNTVIFFLFRKYRDGLLEAITSSLPSTPLSSSADRDDYLIGKNLINISLCKLLTWKSQKNSALGIISLIPNKNC